MVALRPDLPAGPEGPAAGVAARGAIASTLTTRVLRNGSLRLGAVSSGNTPSGGLGAKYSPTNRHRVAGRCFRERDLSRSQSQNGVVSRLDAATRRRAGAHARSDSGSGRL